MDLVILGSRIKERRKSLGLTQQALADAAGYKGKDMISRIESGLINVPMDKVVHLAHALNCKPSDLIGEDVKMTPIDLQIYRSMDGMSDEDKNRILSYIETIRRANLWQQQSGTEHAGGSESHRAE